MRDGHSQLFETLSENKYTNKRTKLQSETKQTKSNGTKIYRTYKADQKFF